MKRGTKKETKWVTASAAMLELGFRNVSSVGRFAKEHGVRTRQHSDNRTWKLYDLDELLEVRKQQGQSARPREATAVEATALSGPTRELVEENVRLQTQVKQLLRARRVPYHEFHNGEVKFGVVSDPHHGSLYTNYTALNAAYEVFAKRGIKRVYLPGDIAAGENMYRGQTYEIYAHGADAQVETIIEKHPKGDEIETFFILGNHDLSFWKRAGVNIGERISAERRDLVYLGDEEADVWIGEGKNRAKLRLLHPGKGTAYALSYHPQKYLEQLSGGEKPEVVLVGHYHKAEMIPMYRNVCLIQCGTCESQTPFMRRQNIAAHVGFWIVECVVNKPQLVSRFRAEFFGVYEESV